MVKSRWLGGFFAAFVFVLSCFVGVAHADEPPLTAPVARSSTEVSYPPGAEGDASVVLELVIEKDGSVSSTAVIEGIEPFAEQARRAALGWRFEPALRGGTPVRARTRAKVEFHAEVTPPTPPPSSSSPAVPEPVEEVTVRGVIREIGQTTMSADDVREMPGAFGEPFRAIEALPGVTPMLSGLAYFVIRGAPPNDNGYFLDGVRVPQLFHVGYGPGVVHPSLVDRIEFYPGAAPASYGRVAGAVIAGQTREPATARHAEFNVRLVDAGGLVESPFAEGRGTALVAGRYGYPGPVVGLFSNIDLSYWDYQSRVTWRAGEKDTFGVFAFGAHDVLAHEENGVRLEDLVSQFHRVDLRYDRAIERGHLRVALTGGYDSGGAKASVAPAGKPDYDQEPSNELRDRSLALRLEFERRVSPAFALRAGADARIDAYDYDPGTPPDSRPVVPVGVDPPPTNISGGAYADAVLRIAPRVELVPGARVDVYSSTRGGTTTTVPAVDPRLAARVGLTSSITWISTLGLAHQYPSLRALRSESLTALFYTGFGFPSGSDRLQSAAQASQGIEWLLPADFTFTTTGFLAGYSGLTDLSAQCIQIMPAVVPVGDGPRVNQAPFHCPNSSSVHGRAYGLEVLVRRPLSKRVSGWIAYTLSRSTREAHFLTEQGADVLATVPSEFDRTHVLNAALAFDLGRRWRAGSRFVFYTGNPYSNLSGNVPVPPYNAYRDPPFFRLDVRLEKRWSVGKNGTIAFVVEGQNVTLSKETSSAAELDCTGSMPADRTSTLNCSRSKVGPITIPSVGVEGSF